MEWLTSLLTEHSVIQAVIVVSLVSAVGLALGKISMWGVSLGVTFVFFAGIMAGHLGLSIDPQMLNYAESFGLIIFVYALGLQVGPGFFSSLGKGGLKLNMLAMLVVLLGIVMTLGFHWTTGVSLPDMMGILSGAVTNTPALGAAQQTLKQLNDPAIQQSDMALGCAVAYPLGVVGVILAIIFVRKLFASSIFFKKENEDKHKKTVVMGFLVSNPGVIGKTIQEIARQSAKKFVVSRLWREDKAIIPASDTLVKEGDCLLAITTEGDVEALAMLIGQRDARDWNKEDIDWDTIDSQLVSHRIVITRPEINGKRLGALRLRNLYGINITRIYRAGIVLLPTPDLTLQVGDRLTVVGEEAAIANVEKVVGNAVKDLDEPNLVAIFIGMVLGLLLGSVPLTIPGISLPVKLGLAGGPIVMGILVGAFGPRIHMVTYTTISANLMLRALGLSMYLACLGLDAGTHFFETVFRPEGALWVALGFAITVVPVLLVAVMSIKWLKIDFGSITGMLCGSMANPMALNYVNTTIESDTPSVAYATVYPLTMFMRVIMAQVILMLFL
ncbi:putative transporter [Butyricimonas paravirosa]|uniref:putative transporter n=1 Tax=Butyricimonas paravirosa TaxID=1472417 RepID=UPI00210B2164|nr:putative transporter [Butyricimonas paravirosa]MCQ4874152.1 putative transporter [Butyricimonas paravirosa]